MLILFDLEIRSPEYFGNIPPGDLPFFLNIKEFILQRIGGLKDEIDIEEAYNAKCKTIINILPGVRNGKVELIYSSELAGKMESCFSDADQNYLSELINELNLAII